MRKTTSRGLAEMTARGGQVEVTLAGVTLGLGNMLNIARNKIQNGIAAYISTTPAVGLTAAEAEQLRSEIGQALLAVPAPMTRETLVMALDDLGAELRGAIEHYSNGDAYDAVLDSRIVAANRAIADWDTQHPDEVAARKAERAESAKRHQWD